MDNGINSRQNEYNSILKLAAQRQIYKEAKKINTIIAIFSLVIPLVLAIVSIFIQNKNWSIISKIMLLASWLCALVLNSEGEKNKKTAALIQQQFDLYVFSLNWDDKLFKNNTNVDSIISEKSEKLFSKFPEQKDKLANWYTKGIYNLPLKKAILLCQEENITWDGKIRNCYMTLSITITFVLLISILCIGIYIHDCLFIIASYIPILQWEITAIIKVKKDIQRLDSLHKMINTDNNYEIDDLMDIQREIYEHRQKCTLINDKIYDSLKDELEKNSEFRVKYEKRKKK